MIALQIALILLCIAGAAFYSGMETGIISIRRLRLRHHAKEGNRDARILMRFLDHPDRLLGTTLVGTNLCVVMASGGYPGPYEKGKTIEGLDTAAGVEDVIVFHAGTARDGGSVVTAGGRVLGVTALGRDLGGAVDRAYQAVSTIRFEGNQYRKDIAAKAMRTHV